MADTVLRFFAVEETASGNVVFVVKYIKVGVIEVIANIDWLNYLVGWASNSFDWKIASVKSRLNWESSRYSLRSICSRSEAHSYFG